jgi:hypothetical protein
MGRKVEVIVSCGGLHEKHAVQRGVLGTNSAFAQGPRKTTKNLDQDLPDANCLLDVRTHRTSPRRPDRGP